MDESQIKKLILRASIVFWVFAILIYLVAYQQFRYSAIRGDSLSPSMITSEFVDGDIVEQRLSISADQITSFDIRVLNFGRVNTGILNAELLDSSGNTIAISSTDISTLNRDNEFISIGFQNAAEIDNGQDLVLRLSTEGCHSGNAIAIYSGNSINTGRFDILKEIEQEDVYTVNGNPGIGMLCIRLNGICYSIAYILYWVIAASAYLIALTYSLYSLKKMKRGQNSLFVGIVTMVLKYGFLLKQLISRDFKAKYKRSSLGMLWSFLNPLLTMSVQYIVFSTLFRSDIPNYPVYLLIGIVMFNFFNEAVSLGMTSVTGNASLIKKVYMPKYIYPVSRVCSSCINFALSFIPIFLVMIITRTSFHWSLLLLLYCIACMLMFVLGMVLLLSTMMAFFQDTQFIWGVLSMIWMYATPVFYPESIIPANFLTIYHMNPMYQYLTFARIVIIDGVSPVPMAYVWCLIPSLVVFVIGALVFKKEQDKFVLNL